jgi:hypothetical protein
MEAYSNELAVLVGRIDAKLDILLTRSDSHEVRLGKLEEAQYLKRGSNKVVYAIAGALGAVILAAFQFLPILH